MRPQPQNHFKVQKRETPCPNQIPLIRNRQQVLLPQIFQQA
jgi:hypothetical protein